MSSDVPYKHYWEQKRLLQRHPPPMPIVRLWEGEGLCELELLYLEALAGAERLLDVGAGDKRVMHRLQSAGLQSEYLTMDVGGEYSHDYSALSQAEGSFEAILCLDVIEHLPLEEGLRLLEDLVDRLTTGGRLILQTPNARCIRHATAGDMTHIHSYNLPDLWAFLTVRGMEVRGYRVVLSPPPRTPLQLLRSALTAFVTSSVLGVDYADNIALIAVKGEGS